MTTYLHVRNMYIYTHTHTHIYIYICICVRMITAVSIPRCCPPVAAATAACPNTWQGQHVWDERWAASNRQQQHMHQTKRNNTAVHTYMHTCDNYRNTAVHYIYIYICIYTYIHIPYTRIYAQIPTWLSAYLHTHIYTYTHVLQSHTCNTYR